MEQTLIVLQLKFNRTIRPTGMFVMNNLLSQSLLDIKEPKKDVARLFCFDDSL